MKNILPSRETNTYGWLLIGLLGLMLLRGLLGLLGGVGAIVLNVFNIFYALLITLLSIGILFSYAGILYRIKGSVVAIWVLPFIGLLSILTPIFLGGYGLGFSVFGVFGLIIPFIVPLIVTLATRPFWPSFRPLSEVREEGFSRALLRLPSDVESNYMEGQQSYSPSSPPSSQAQSKPDDKTPWF